MQVGKYQVEICLHSYLSYKKKSFKDMEYFIYLSWPGLTSFANLIDSHFPPFIIFWIVWQAFKNPKKIYVWLVIIQL